MSGTSQALASRTAAPAEQYGSSALAMTTAGTGSRAGMAARNDGAARGKAGDPVSGGATRKAPRTRLPVRTSHSVAARPPRLCVTRTVSGPRWPAAAVMAAHQLSRSGSVQEAGSMRVARGPQCSSHKLCQCRSPELSMPGTITKSMSALTRVEDLQRIKCLADCVLHRQCGWVEFPAHAVPFQDADAMLAGDRAAKVDGRVQELLEGRLRRYARRLVAGRGDDQRMQVAVARMRDRRDLDVMPGRDLGNPSQHDRDPRPGYADILGQDRAQSFQGRVGQPPGIE